MTNRKEVLRNLLKLEVADKSEASCISFILFAVFSFVYHYGCTQYITLIKSTAMALVLINSIRYVIIRKLKKQKIVSDREWRLLILLIWINSLGWSIIFNTASFELKLSGIHFIVVTTLLAGFIGASIVTLSYFPILFLPFQFLLLVPQIGVILYYYLSPDHINLLPLIFLYLMYFFYQLKQFKDFRKENLKRFNYQIDLEIANNELKQSKEELIDQTVQLVHVSRLAALGEMSAGIAHEINNPLTIMKGGAQLIEKVVQRGTFDRELILKQSQKIQHSINRVTAIIRGLKNFSNLSDNHPKEMTSLSEIIDDTTNFCSELLRTHDIRFEVEKVPEYRINCHPVQISQVLINLIKNAQDFIVEHSADSDDRWIRISFEKNSNSIMIKVSNSGNKISDEVATKIFQPFFSTKPMGEGTGLGLSISQKIIKEHNGDIALDHSAPNTTFTVMLPNS